MYYKLLLVYYKHKYNKNVKPIQIRNDKSTPKKTKCLYCGTILTEQKQRKHFKRHKCNNSKYSYYQININKFPKDLDRANKYKLHYIYCEFNINFI